ncbi:MAG: hypothetical protein LBT05_11930 [Planctomycetaceae bacterium]|nr:hypothetical protein [Planctomycetaceae bacterium]
MTKGIEKCLISSCVKHLESSNDLMEVAQELLPESDEKRKIGELIAKNKEVIETGKKIVNETDLSQNKA